MPAWGTDGKGGVGTITGNRVAVKFLYDCVFDAITTNKQVTSDNRPHNFPKVISSLHLELLCMHTTIQCWVRSSWPNMPTSKLAWHMMNLAATCAPGTEGCKLQRSAYWQAPKSSSHLSIAKCVLRVSAASCALLLCSSASALVLRYMAPSMQVYETIALPIIHPVMNGISGTIFAYGVTSSGKTHTMMGCAADPGLVPRSIKTIFDIISSQTDRLVAF